MQGLSRENVRNSRREIPFQNMAALLQGHKSWPHKNQRNRRMTSNSLKEETNYLVVSFNEPNIANEETVDLICRSWAVCDEGTWFCQYPNPKDYLKRNRWLKESKDPEPEWIRYKITILKEARDYEQGTRRLRRSYKDTNVASTDENDCDGTDTLPIKLSKGTRKSFLQESIIEEMNSSQETEIISTPESRHLPSATGVHLNQLSTNNDVTDNITSTPKSARRMLHKDNEPKDKDINGNVSPSAKPRENISQRASQVDVANVADDDDISRGNWMGYIDEKMGELDIKITAAITSAKRSILYDLNKKMDEIKNTIIVSVGGNAQGGNVSSVRDQLGTALPIKSLDDFLTFEIELSTDDQKKQSLKSLITVLIAGSNSWRDDVGKILNAILSKAVQIHYSGCGRKVKGKGKRNFSETVVFSCMKDVIEEHYKNITEPLQLVSRVSRWLAGAGDREGGRVGRSTNA
ncbi:uncharacterized protein LOC125500187 [Athalia rosae]|uniref:uncharacterized protein LOC125500187 n=1 Tax=Athalia rosae TaxID=37344 RepID=UPI0020340211|nr:uncharacterized protein LOC125500187 [Athalia rosae]